MRPVRIVAPTKVQTVDRLSRQFVPTRPLIICQQRQHLGHRLFVTLRVCEVRRSAVGRSLTAPAAIAARLLGEPGIAPTIVARPFSPRASVGRWAAVRPGAVYRARFPVPFHIWREACSLNLAYGGALLACQLQSVDHFGLLEGPDVLRLQGELAQPRELLRRQHGFQVALTPFGELDKPPPTVVVVKRFERRPQCLFVSLPARQQLLHLPVLGLAEAQLASNDGVIKLIGLRIAMQDFQLAQNAFDTLLDGGQIGLRGGVAPPLVDKILVEQERRLQQPLARVRDEHVVGQFFFAHFDESVDRLPGLAKHLFGLVRPLLLAIARRGRLLLLARDHAIAERNGDEPHNQQQHTGHEPTA